MIAEVISDHAAALLNRFHPNDSNGSGKFAHLQRQHRERVSPEPMAASGIGSMRAAKRMMRNGDDRAWEMAVQSAVANQRA